jgi:hypothetical protein
VGQAAERPRWRRGWARLLNVPVYDLDAVAYGSGGCRRDPGQRRAAAERIAESDSWITEGIYLAFCDPLAERADAIVWLDVAWRVAAYRIVRRHILLSLAGTNRHPGMGRLARFVLATRHYYLARALPATTAADDGAITRLATRDWLRRYSAKVIRCQATPDLDELHR